jgi:hypothetical protein
MSPQSSGDPGNQGLGDEIYADADPADADPADAGSVEAGSVEASIDSTGANAAEAEADRLLNEASSGEKSETERVLAEVLEETIRAVSGKAALDVMRRVAGRPGNDNIRDPSTCEELVREILKERFAIGALPGDIPERVAENLLEDPRVSNRLVSLWNEVRGHVG